jgi:hypothetical protein
MLINIFLLTVPVLAELFANDLTMRTLRVGRLRAIAEAQLYSRLAGSILAFTCPGSADVGLAESAAAVAERLHLELEPNLILYVGRMT